MAMFDESLARPVAGELVADLEHLPLIERGLKDLGLERGKDYSKKAEDETLGLAQLTGFDDAEGAMDGLLYELRRRFSGRYGGWCPQLGHQRTAHLIRPAGPKPMSEGEPQSAGPVTIVGATAAGDSDIKVGVVDTPVYHHVSLPEEWVNTRWATEPPPAGISRAGHGTFVTSLIRKRAPRARVTVKGVLKDLGYTADAWDVAVAITELARHVDILNLSFACFTADGEAPLVIRRAIERVPAHVTVVAAAGNQGDVVGLVRGRTSRSPSFPAALPRVIAVGSSGLIGAGDPDSLEPSEFTPKSPWGDYTVRGVDVTGAFPGEPLVGGVYGAWVKWSGTSFAAAEFTGLVAGKMAGGLSASKALEQLVGEGTVRKFDMPDGV